MYNNQVLLKIVFLDESPDVPMDLHSRNSNVTPGRGRVGEWMSQHGHGTNRKVVVCLWRRRLPKHMDPEMIGHTAQPPLINGQEYVDQ